MRNRSLAQISPVRLAACIERFAAPQKPSHEPPPLDNPQHLRVAWGDILRVPASSEASPNPLAPDKEHCNMLALQPPAGLSLHSVSYRCAAIHPGLPNHRTHPRPRWNSKFGVRSAARGTCSGIGMCNETQSRGTTSPSTTSGLTRMHVTLCRSSWQACQLSPSELLGMLVSRTLAVPHCRQQSEHAIASGPLRGSRGLERSSEVARRSSFSTVSK